MDGAIESTLLAADEELLRRKEWEIADVEALRPHYALTLRHWVARLERSHDEALRYVNESTYRVWRLYMAACALEFESGEIGVYQVLASKRSVGAARLPLTREHLHSKRNHLSASNMSLEASGEPASTAFAQASESWATALRRMPT